MLAKDHQKSTRNRKLAKRINNPFRQIKALNKQRERERERESQTRNKGKDCSSPFLLVRLTGYSYSGR